MSSRKDFLVEIGTEELPPKALLILSNEFRRGIEVGLGVKLLAHGESETYATPRRLAVRIKDLVTRQEDQSVARRGPAVSAAFDAAGNPTKAATGFAKSCGVEVGALGRTQNDKGEWLSFDAEIQGESTNLLLPAIVSESLSKLPIPKRMRWGSGTVEFVRPVHWIMMLHGNEIINGTILNVESGRITRGHRFHSPAPIKLDSSEDYPGVLQSAGFVIASFEQRRELIATGSQDLAAQLGARAIISPNLIDEVTALVEWPVPICGTFDEHFLDLPREVLIASMQDHQKYFPVESPDGVLLNKFITVANIDSLDPDAVRSGNERVIRPRLSDAAFFWSQDRKTALSERLSRLDDVVFEKQLGSLKEKTDRVATLARHLAKMFAADNDLTSRAATLARCDLLTDMVGEFPELQGLMGSYYAAGDGEPSQVSEALAEFYMPRFARDTIPGTAIGRCIAFADKLDTLVGIFSIGAAPTGDKDPFALRRAALGCIRIVIESGAGLDLNEALDLACQGYSDVIDTSNVSEPVIKFIIDRMRGYFSEKGIDTSTIDAVLAVGTPNPTDIHARIEAVVAFQQLPESSALAGANKRIANILRKNDAKTAASIDPKLLEADAEVQLVASLDSITQSINDSLDERNYSAFLTVLSELHDPINLFFDDVMVMCDDIAVRDNRMAILSHIHGLFSVVADIARLND
jgi:glycyl-tRNA synthetase beta chain